MHGKKRALEDASTLSTKRTTETTRGTLLHLDDSLRVKNEQAKRIEEQHSQILKLDERNDKLSQRIDQQNEFIRELLDAQRKSTYQCQQQRKEGEELENKLKTCQDMFGNFVTDAENFRSQAERQRLRHIDAQMEITTLKNSIGHKANEIKALEALLTSTQKENIKSLVRLTEEAKKRFHDYADKLEPGAVDLGSAPAKERSDSIGQNSPAMFVSTRHLEVVLPELSTQQLA